MIIAQTYPYTGNGLGGLPDALEAIVTHEINGQYELFLRYPVTGLHYEELISGRIIMAAPDDLTDEQPFRIYRITKPLNGIVSVYARHLCYDLQGIVVEPFTAGSLTEAFQVIPTKCTPTSPITLQTTRSVASGITLTEPRPMWKLLGGQEGSLLDVYGGEWDFDKDEATLVTTLGADRGVSIRYGKNMTEMEQDASIEACYSAVYPFWYDEESSTLVNLPEKTVAVTGAVVSNRVMVLDCSDDFDNQPTEQQLRDRANAYITANSIGNVKASWKISFVDTQGLPFDKVMLGDTLHVYYERLDVNATARAVKTEYDVLQGRYKAITVGRVKQNLAAIIVENQEKTESEFAKVKSDLETAVDDATDFIRNGAGYMRFIYNSSDELQEIVSLDDPDITQAQKVWRWNNGGFGFSSTGYSGPYTLAITQNGAIVADFITAGTLNANVIRAGILQDAAGKNSWNMQTGAFTITNGTINITTTSQTNDVIQFQYNEWKNKFSPLEYKIINTSTQRAIQIQAGGIFAYSNYVENGQNTLRTLIQDGMLHQYDGNGKERTYLEYGDIYLKDASEVTRTHLNSQGVLNLGVSSGQVTTLSPSGMTLTDSNGTARLSAYGSTGGIWLQKASDLNTSVFIQDTSDVTRMQLSKDGLSFFNASGTKTAEYPADFPTWTYAFAANSGQVAPVNCNGTVDKFSHIITIDTQNRIVGFSGRARITGFSRSGPNPGIQIDLRGDIGSAVSKRTWYGGTVSNQSGTILSETIYADINQGRLNLRCTESAVNISGSTLYIIMPQTFLKY